MTTALEGGEGTASRPGRSLPPGKTRYPLYRRLGGLQGRSGRVQKISPPQGFDPLTAQPVAIRYTDYTIGTTKERKGYWKLKGGSIRWHCVENLLWERLRNCSRRDYGTEWLCRVIRTGSVHRNGSVAPYGYNIDTEYRLSQICNENNDLYHRCIDVYSK